MQPFTEAELLAKSAAYLGELKESGRLQNGSPRVCHHFFPLDGADLNVYLPILPEIIANVSPGSEVDVIGDPIGLEVWDFQKPATAWLNPRIRAFHAAAVACSAVYGGWTFELDERGERHLTTQ